MRRFLLLTIFVVGCVGAAIFAWRSLDGFTPGPIGTPARAGIVSNGRPDQCQTINIAVGARAQEQAVVPLLEDGVLRGTFEADGGFGNVDIMMRIVSPRGDELLVSPRASNYDFTLIPDIAGDYTFIFDNRYSLVTSKAVGFFYCLPTG